MKLVKKQFLREFCIFLKTKLLKKIGNFIRIMQKISLMEVSVSVFTEKRYFLRKNTLKKSNPQKKVWT